MTVVLGHLILGNPKPCITPTEPLCNPFNGTTRGRIRHDKPPYKWQQDLTCLDLGLGFRNYGLGFGFRD